jgi:hypothetical protein
MSRGEFFGCKNHHKKNIFLNLNLSGEIFFSNGRALIFVFVNHGFDGSISCFFFFNYVWVFRDTNLKRLGGKNMISSYRTSLCFFKHLQINPHYIHSVKVPQKHQPAPFQHILLHNLQRVEDQLMCQAENPQVTFKKLKTNTHFDVYFSINFCVYFLYFQSLKCV